MKIRIRPMRPGHQEAVDYCRGGYGEHVVPKNIAEVIGDAVLPAGFIAIDQDGQFVGRAVMGFEVDPDFHVQVAGGVLAPWIYAVFVEDRFRGQGIGTALIQSCLHYLATECRASFVCLDSNTAGPWYVNKFHFSKSHSGIYEGETFDIYYRALDSEMTEAGPASLEVSAYRVGKPSIISKSEMAMAQKLAADAVHGRWPDPADFGFKHR